MLNSIKAVDYIKDYEFQKQKCPRKQFQTRTPMKNKTPNEIRLTSTSKRLQEQNIGLHKLNCLDSKVGDADTEAERDKVD